MLDILILGAFFIALIGLIGFLFSIHWSLGVLFLVLIISTWR